MNFHEATESFEQWLRGQIALIDHDVHAKHKKMREAIFSFLRGTFYRWVQLWPELCPELAAAPKVLAVGDLHLENFGTWRDAEGRLVWGINDFDEAHSLSYANDLVRLAASAKLAIEENHLSLPFAHVCDAFLEGYTEWLERGGRPYVLAEKATWLRTLAMERVRDGATFWDILQKNPPPDKPVPKEALELLEAALPEPKLPYQLSQRMAGMGSLGRPRFVALATWRGGMIAREAKAMIPSACVWADPKSSSNERLDLTLLSRAVRSPDPMIRVVPGWLCRRLAPDCIKLDLAMLPEPDDAMRYLKAMGRETANIHLASSDAIPAIRDDLKKRRVDWLAAAAQTMVADVKKDFEEFRREKAS